MPQEFTIDRLMRNRARISALPSGVRDAFLGQAFDTLVADRLPKDLTPAERSEAKDSFRSTFTGTPKPLPESFGNRLEPSIKSAFSVGAASVPENLLGIVGAKQTQKKLSDFLAPAKVEAGKYAAVHPTKATIAYLAGQAGAAAPVDLIPGGGLVSKVVKGVAAGAAYTGSKAGAVAGGVLGAAGGLMTRGMASRAASKVATAATKVAPTTVPAATTTASAEHLTDDLISRAREELQNAKLPTDIPAIKARAMAMQQAAVAAKEHMGLGSPDALRLKAAKESILASKATLAEQRAAKLAAKAAPPAKVEKLTETEVADAHDKLKLTRRMAAKDPAATRAKLSALTPDDVRHVAEQHPESLKGANAVADVAKTVNPTPKFTGGKEYSGKVSKARAMKASAAKVAGGTRRAPKASETPLADEYLKQFGGR